MKVRVEDLQVGCILQKDIMGKTNYPLIPANTVLTDIHIEFLHAFFIEEAEIHIRMQNGELFNSADYVEQEESVGQKEKTHRLGSSFVDSYLSAIQQYKKEFISWQSGVGVNIANIRAILLPLIAKAEESKDWIRNIHLYSNKEDYLYNHPIAVSLIANMLANGMGYDKGQCLQIALAGCLADCGMAKVSSSTLKKMGPLTQHEWNEIKKHPVYSYQMIKDIPLLKTETKLAIFQHHERLDGSGYPLGEKGIRVHPQSQIVAMADMYHAMTAERIYKEMQSPFKTLQIMEEDHFGQFDISILKVLTSAIASLPVGTLVQLSNYKTAEIIFIKPDALTRPLIKIVETEEMIDLERNRQLYIKKVLREGQPL